jgi:hypothetical protein
MSEDKEFERILEISSQIADEHPGVVFIGGVAIYLHARNKRETGKFAESSHDSDFMVSLEDFGSLRHTDEVRKNRRLNKHEMSRDGVSFDVYVEHENGLTVPYDEVFAHSASYDGMRVACLEHLLILKVEAYLSRSASSKGKKDARDLLILARVFNGGVKAALVLPYLRKEHVEALERIGGSSVFMDVTKRNAHDARMLRLLFLNFVSALRARLPKR